MVQPRPPHSCSALRRQPRNSSPQTGGATAQSPDARGAIRVIIMERLTNEMQGGLQERVSQAADTLSQLTPEQRTAIRAAIRARLADDAREGMPAALSERIADKLGIDVQLPPGARVLAGSADQAPQRHSRAASEEMRERIADRLADAAATLASLSPEQRAQVLAAVRQGSATRSRIGLDIALPRRSARSCPTRPSVQAPSRTNASSFVTRRHKRRSTLMSLRRGRWSMKVCSTESGTV